MATTRAVRRFTAVAAEPRGRVLAPVEAVPDDPAVRGRAAARAPGDAWALARDAAGGLVVLGFWAALWAWFLAATL